MQFEAVRAVAFQEWNPVGTDDLPEDEYDSYVWQIVGLLREGATRDEVAGHLAAIERTWFDRHVDSVGLLSVADAFIALGIGDKQ